jgi:hypothetical protein
MEVNSMKKVCLPLFLGLLVLGISTRPAQALPEFKKKFDARYVETSTSEPFRAAVEEAKCNVCHYGTSKKNRNDYGTALSQLLHKDNFKTDRIKAEPDVVEREIYDAFGKVEGMKSVNGFTFGELLRSGHLPGTEPADAGASE